MKKKPLQILSRIAIALGLVGLCLIAIQVRKGVISLKCADSPQLCDVNALPAFERWAVGRWDPVVNHWSFVTQNLSGLLCLFLPILLGLLYRKKVRLIGHAFLDDVLLLVSGAGLNGFANELFRMTVQRPRPFVYQDPPAFGQVEAHYTSFYSGHTSFSALATLLLYMIVSRRFPDLAKRHPILNGAVASLVIVLPLTTGLLRVVAGRHFPTDVLGGAIAGFLWAYLSVRFLSAWRA